MLEEGTLRLQKTQKDCGHFVARRAINRRYWPQFLRSQNRFCVSLSESELIYFQLIAEQ